METNKVKLISGGHVNKNIHRNDIMLRCFILINMINGRSVLDSEEKFKEDDKYQSKNIIWEILYVVSVRMSV